MARRRMLDPKIWDSEDFGSLKLLARITFVGMFSLADDEGRGNASPVFIKGNVFKYDFDLRLADIEEALLEIGNKMSVEFYQVENKKYYSLTHWDRWQKVEKPYKSILPPPPSLGEGGDIVKNEKFRSYSGNVRGTFGEQSEDVPAISTSISISTSIDDDTARVRATSSPFTPNRAKELCQQYAPTYFKADHDYGRNDFAAFYEAIDDPQNPLTETTFIELLKSAERSEFIGTWKVVTLKGLLNNRQRILNGEFKELFNKQQPSQFSDFEQTEYSKEELAGLYDNIGEIERL